MTEFRVFADSAACAKAIADAFLVRAAELLAEKAEIHVSITGGTLGIQSLAAIAEHANLQNIDWSRVHIWWGDERYVASNSADRNAVQARTALLQFIPDAKLHEFPSADAGESVFEAADRFASEVAAFQVGSAVSFDITLLGMGPDGHIASLFPGKPLPAAGLSVIAEDDSPKPPPQRLSFTYEAISASDEIWFLVAGAEKAEPAAIANSNAADSLPAGRVHGRAKTIWFLDEAAASKLT